ncbi:hypothetical protein B0J14DRAFT_561095 [Halenospora varia]|nr:hypothetical protein B0J14DRAFT_561095 [Halenospora varia]
MSNPTDDSTIPDSPMMQELEQSTTSAGVAYPNGHLMIQDRRKDQFSETSPSLPLSSSYPSLASSLSDHGSSLHDQQHDPLLLPPPASHLQCLATRPPQYPLLAPRLDPFDSLLEGIYLDSAFFENIFHLEGGAVIANCEDGTSGMAVVLDDGAVKVPEIDLPPSQLVIESGSDRGGSPVRVNHEAGTSGIGVMLDDSDEELLALKL